MLYCVFCTQCVLCTLKENNLKPESNSFCVCTYLASEARCDLMLMNSACKRINVLCFLSKVASRFNFDTDNILFPFSKAYLQLYVGNERSRINPDGMYVGKVYSDMNRVTINKTFQRSGRLLAVYPRPFSSTFGIAGPVMAWLNEVAVGREGSTLTWWAVTPSPPFLTPCGKWRRAPGGVEAKWWGSTMERWWWCPEIRGLETKWKGKQNKTTRWVCFNIPCT